MRRPGTLLTVVTAWVGVVAGHLIAYLLTYPSDPIRHIHLAVTGHTWIGLATASLLAAVPVILVAAAVRAVGAEGSWSGAGLALRLTAIQVPAFALIELLERRGSLDRTLADPAVFVGLVLLPLVAVIAAWLLDLLGRAVRAVVGRLLRTRRVAPRAFLRPVPEQLPPRHRLLLPARLRAPPLPLPA